jgi:hypothetical protein
MRNRLKVVIVALVGVAAGIVVVWKLAPDRRSAEQQILDALVDIERAVEEKNIRHCMKHVSESYHDADVENKRELQQLAISGLREPGQFEVVLQPDRPVVRGLEATVVVRVDFAVARGQSINRVAPFDVETRWVKEGRKWRVVEAKGYMEAEQGFIDSY